MRIRPSEFLAQPLRAHDFLDDIPLEDAWSIPLMGGGAGRTVADLRELILNSRAEAPFPAKLLFWLRERLGSLFRWDAARSEWEAESHAQRLSDADRSRSLVASGTPDGSFRLLYRFEREQLSELRNATVHAFVSLSLCEVPGGYRAYLGIFVRPVHRLTRLYMSAIAPFRYWIVYPAITRMVQRKWAARYAAAPEAGHACPASAPAANGQK